MKLFVSQGIPDGVVIKFDFRKAYQYSAICRTA